MRTSRGRIWMLPGGLRTAARWIERSWTRALLACGAFLMLLMPALHARSLNNIVFYYGDAPLVPLLSLFDVAVVQPVEDFRPPRPRRHRTRWLAYVSVGEIESSSSYYSDIPDSWIVERNEVWNADILDQTAPGWPDFLVTRILAPLWASGYTGFFLDTLDSYHLLDADPALREQQRRSLVQIILRIRRTYPGAMLILNRGFELLPDVHSQVDAVAFESLFQGWNQDAQRYEPVSQDERDWLLARVVEIKAWHLTAISIDYCPPDDGQCTLRTAARIRDLGIIPYIGDGHLLEVNRLLLPAR